MQNLRTEAAAVRAVELSNTLQATVGQEEPDFNLKIREAVQMSMMTFAREFNSVSDLKVILLKNRTAIPFVTSDNPAIITNRWYLLNKSRCGLSFGLKSSGLLAFLPLSPKILCVGYDGDVYSISHVDGWANVHNETDIDAFNQHQYLNCNANVYVHNPKYAQLIDLAFKCVKGVRPATTHRVNYAVPDIIQSGYTRYKVVDRGRAADDGEGLVHMQRIYPEPTRWPRQISWRRKGVVFTNGSGVGYVRRAWVNEFGDPVYWKERT